jgi:homocysteine S-methyltransferase
VSAPPSPSAADRGERRPVTNPFAPILARQSLVLLDGGLATALEARGHDLSHHLWSARILVEQPAEIAAVHEAYLRAGSDCITTSSYQATVEGFVRFGLSHSDALSMLDRSTQLAVAARDRVYVERLAVEPAMDLSGTPAAAIPRALVAASIGPYGAYLADGSEYTGRYDLDRSGLRSFHTERFHRLARSPADLLACETIPSREEAQVLAELIEESGRWAWLSFSCRDGGHLNDGTRVEEAIDSVRATPGLAALGVNCTAPQFITPLIRRIRSRTQLPVIVYPNSGEVYDPVGKSWDANAVDGGWGDSPTEWIREGARILGGCCRVGPRTIARLKPLSQAPGPGR